MAEYAVFVNGLETPELYDLLSAIDVEESVDLPGAFQLEMTVQVEEGDLTPLASATFAPFSNIAVTASVAGGGDVCLIDGYVLSHEVHLRHGVAESTVRVWGQDASVLMNREERVRPFPDMSDSDVATSIFGEYGFIPDVEASPTRHLETRHLLMQRATDIRFLRMLARRNGFVCYVRCEAQPGVITGHFHRPRVSGDAAAVVQLNAGEETNVDTLELEWDTARPTGATTSQYDVLNHATLTQSASTSGLRSLGDRDLAAFAGRDTAAVLTATAEDAGELQARAEALLTDAGWFVRASGEVDADFLGTIMRPDTVVEVQGAGSVHSGPYWVTRVRHQLRREAYRMAFQLARNGVGGGSIGL